MKTKLNKKEAREIIEEFFKKVKIKTPKEIKKVKRLSMKHKVPLKEKRKTFCKYCFSPYLSPKIRIKENKKSILCDKCNKISRWKI